MGIDLEHGAISTGSCTEARGTIRSSNRVPEDDTPLRPRSSVKVTRIRVAESRFRAGVGCSGHASVMLGSAMISCTGHSGGTHRICDLAFEPHLCQAQLGPKVIESLHGIPSQGFNVNNSNDQKSTSNESADKKASDDKKVASPQTEVPVEKQEPAKNAQSPAQSSR